VIWTLALLGAAAGAGLWLAVTGLVPGRPGLAEVLAAMDYEAPVAPPPPASLDERVGRLLGELFGEDRIRPNARRRSDLALLEKPEATHAGSKVASAVSAMLVGPALALVLGMMGFGVHWQFPALLSLALGAAGYLLPDLVLRSQAEERRRAIRRELSGFLDVVNLELAGNELISGALEKAARAGEGIVYRLLRRTLDTAAERGIAPWDAIAAVAEERNIDELTELAASARGAGTSGARVRRTLSAKAASLRVKTLADMLAEANAATTKMLLPLAGFATGFMILTLYPPIAHIVGGS
jgi:tight adherence protein C